jgi:hypothetical protein
MSHSVSWFDRLRVERVVWSLDQRLYDLPRASRIATRREVRANLLTAARDVGTTEALRRIGSSSELAAGYLTAEFGDQPRPSWLAAALFLFTGMLVFTSILNEAALAFRDGILAADPTATGSYLWHGIPYLQTGVTVTLQAGQGSYTGGAMTPLAWVLWLGSAFLVGRLWRLPATWRRRRARAAAAA